MKRENIDFIIFAIKQSKAAVKFGFTPNECSHNLKSALHQYWQNKTLKTSGISQKKKIKRSKAALNRPLNECRIEHTVPYSVIIKRLMEMKSVNAESVEKFLKHWFVVSLVTLEEDERLVASGLRSKMPEHWDKRDVFARYRKVGIEMPD